MPKTNTFDNQILDYLFNDNDIPDLGSTLYLSLHTVSPGVAGNFNEPSLAVYINYARQPLTRGGFTIANQKFTLGTDIVFPECDFVQPIFLVSFGISTTLTGNTGMLYFGSLFPVIMAVSGTSPTLSATSTITEN